MFALVHGPWPRVAVDGTDLAVLEAQVETGQLAADELRAATERLVAEIVQAQADAGIDLVTDGQVRWPDLALAVATTLAGAGDDAGSALVEAWRATAALTDRPVAQAIPGPFTLGRRAGGAFAERAHRTRAIAQALAGEMRALAEAGCPMVLVEEPLAVDVGEDADERDLFLEAQQRLLDPVPGLHAMLVVSGGTAHLAGPDAILGAPYRSFLFDLIDGPDNWYLVRATPGDRGIVCGALQVSDPAPRDQAPLLVWASAYAASTAARGTARVGLANARALSHVGPEAARALVAQLGRAARLAAMPPEDAVKAGLDPRTFAQPADRRGGGQKLRSGMGPRTGRKRGQSR